MDVYGKGFKRFTGLANGSILWLKGFNLLLMTWGYVALQFRGIDVKRSIYGLLQLELIYIMFITYMKKRERYTWPWIRFVYNEIYPTKIKKLVHLTWLSWVELWSRWSPSIVAAWVVGQLFRKASLFPWFHK